uniref:Uncharacterized protein n=1 Tax=Arundo donax TaxID=35708 RepID=A0A0A9CJ20_ARUDO
MYKGIFPGLGRSNFTEDQSISLLPNLRSNHLDCFGICYCMFIKFPSMIPMICLLCVSFAFCFHFFNRRIGKSSPDLVLLDTMHIGFMKKKDIKGKKL